MTNSTPSLNSIAQQTAPSRQQVLRATIFAAAVATVIFFTAVLPAEFGKDPLHTGAALGLMNLSKASAAEAAPSPSNAGAAATMNGAAPVLRIIAPTEEAAASGAGEVVAVSGAGEFVAPVVTGVYVAQPISYKTDSRTLKLGPGEGLEIKYHMAKGAGMVYSWEASGKVLYEFHGEPDVKPANAGKDYFESYEKDDVKGNTQSHGTFTAPSTGVEGWFWDNESDSPVTIRLTTAGFYDYILQNKDDVKTRLTPSDPQ